MSICLSRCGFFVKGATLAADQTARKASTAASVNEKSLQGPGDMTRHPNQLDGAMMQLTDEQRAQLEFIERCDPAFLIAHVEERTAFDANALAKVFDLAKERARALLSASKPAAPTVEDVVTRSSALAAISHLSLSNSPGREHDAIAMLAAAPAQSAEPVAWFTEDHLVDKSATTWDRNVAERWKAKGWPVTALCIAPQSSLPAKAGEPCAHDYVRSDGICTECGRASQAAHTEMPKTINEAFDAAMQQSKTDPALLRKLKEAATQSAVVLDDERVAFEAKFGVMSGVAWDGTDYVILPAWKNDSLCSRFIDYWTAWQARAASPQSPKGDDRSAQKPIRKTYSAIMAEELGYIPDTRAASPQATATPMQPLVTDAQGTVRFKENAIVRHLLDNGGIDLNTLGALEFTDEDRQQFAQLIGYSVSGYGELRYVSDRSYERAAAGVAAIAASAGNDAR
jgi:hypothetical protein